SPPNAPPKRIIWASGQSTLHLRPECSHAETLPTPRTRMFIAGASWPVLIKRLYGHFRATAMACAPSPEPSFRRRPETQVFAPVYEGGLRLQARSEGVGGVLPRPVRYREPHTQQSNPIS